MATDAARKRKWEVYYETFHIRFWDRVKKGVPSECWPYLGTKRANGYGRLRLRGKYELAHRMAYRLSVGQIPDGLMVCHRCDNPICCNPEHLFLGTHEDNMADRNRKGRYKLPKALRDRNAALKARAEPSR